MNAHQNMSHSDDLVSIDEVFKDFYQKYGKIGSTIRGYRSRENMTQKTLVSLSRSNFYPIDE